MAGRKLRDGFVHAPNLVGQMLPLREIRPRGRGQFLVHLRVVEVDGHCTTPPGAQRADAIETDPLRNPFEIRPFGVAAVFGDRAVKAHEGVLREVLRVLLGHVERAHEVPDESSKVLLVERLDQVVTFAANLIRHRSVPSARNAYLSELVKKLAVIAVSLFSLASRCGREDTIGPEKWRVFAPRLAETSEYVQCTDLPLQEGQVVPTSRCGNPPAERPDACDELMTSRADAARMLATRPYCIDRAISVLERLASGDEDVATDLAAAYYVRAQRQDQPLDFFRALEHAQQAITSGKPAALFNYALVQETLGFTAEAIAAWDRYLAKDPTSPWAAEARTRRAALEKARSHDAHSVWEQNRAAIPGALQRGDRVAIARLIEPFPRSAWMYFEAEVLGRWAEDPTPQRLQEARLYAEELSKRTQDRFAIDVVATLSPALVEAHRRHSEGIRARRAHLAEESKRLFQEAATLFERAHSPMLLSVRNYQGTPDVEGSVRYPHLHAYARAQRGYGLFYDFRYLDALSDDEAAQAEFRRVGDRESEYSMYAATLGVYRILGQTDVMSTELFRSRDYATALADLERRNLYLGEAALFAQDLGNAQVALIYQNANLAGMSAADHKDARVRHNLAIAYRARAGIYASLERFTDAQRDLASSDAYDDSDDPGTVEALEARRQEVRARTLRGAAAVDAFTQAIELAGDKEYLTLRADLHVQRAAALRSVGRHTEAEADLWRALELVRAEEDELLQRQETHEEADRIIWNAYVSRFDEAYDALITQLVDTRRTDLAFAVAEETRAYEPLQRLLQYGNAAREFRQLLGAQRHLSLSQIQTHLPTDTALVAYTVLETKTYAWIVTRNRIDFVTLDARGRDIARWSADLDNAFNRSSETDLQKGLYAPYDKLIAPVLARTRGTPRLVIIPDDAMQGLPFPALRDRPSNKYLVEQAIITTSPSATLYIHSLMRDAELSRTGNPTTLLIGDPAFDATLSIARDLTRLSGARREIQQLEALYGQPALMNEEATISEFLRLAPRAEIIQVAAHGIVNARMPQRSALLLARDATHYGVLDASTLMTQFHAGKTRLMVLSACSSAGGLPVGSEGVAPLVRPILAAGVPGVVGTLSYITDATSADLMVSFHRHYRQNRDAALALHDAQVEMLTKNKGAGSALNWAPFHVIGYASSPFPAPNTKEGEPP